MVVAAVAAASLAAEAAAWNKRDFDGSGRQQRQHRDDNENGSVAGGDNIRGMVF